MDTENKNEYSIHSTLGIGPAGRIVRIVWWYARCKRLGSTLVFDKYTANWWSSVFSSSFFEVKNVSGAPVKVEQDLKLLFPDSEEREQYIQTCAREILTVHSHILLELPQLPLDYHCLYWRGTDKILEVPFYPLPLFRETLDEIKPELPLVGVSDSQYCIDELKKAYPAILVTDIAKSKDEFPLHIHPKQKQEELLKGCVLDALVMSRARALIYSHSMMVNFAKLLNPDLALYSVEHKVDTRLRTILKAMAAYMLYRDRTAKARLNDH